MKKILSIVLFVVVFNGLNAQSSNDNTPAAKLAHHIANKMADTLALTNQQKAKIFAVNMELNRQKMAARGKPQDRTSVGTDLQKIESSRDGYYKTVLTAGQYQAYLQKKRNLVTAK